MKYVMGVIVGLCSMVVSFCGQFFSKAAAPAAKTALGVGALVIAGAANAALPTVIGTSLDALEVDALALIDLLWPIIMVITGGFILIKLFKRGSSKI